MKIRTAVMLAIIAVLPLSAQIEPPNAAGVAIGHFHINASDMEAQERFWTLVGGVTVPTDKRKMIEFPGGYVILQKRDSTGGSAGSVINHVGLRFKNVAEWVPKWKAAGLTFEPGDNPKQFFLVAPDNIRVEMFEDPSISTPVAMHHIHLFATDPPAVQAWYVKHFGAIAGKRGRNDTATVPGAEITIGKTDAAQVPSKGRAVDHISFEVRNLNEFVRKLQAEGVQPEAPGIRPSSTSPNLRIAYIADPWGTYIELTEGLPLAR